MRNFLSSKSVQLLTLLAVFSPSIAFAVIDITSVTTALTEVGTAGLAIGAAFIIMLVAMKTFKWVRKAL
jgi:amino acid permease